MPDGEPDADEAVDEEEHEDPRGTMVLLLGFLVLIAVLWIWAYYSLWVRA